MGADIEAPPLTPPPAALAPCDASAGLGLTSSAVLAAVFIEDSSPERRSKVDIEFSSDPDGQITHYAWDLDGDGSMETDGGTSPVLKHTFKKGVHHVTVQVTDNNGRHAYATRTIRVSR